LIWGRASPTSDVLPKKPFICNSAEVVHHDILPKDTLDGMSQEELVTARGFAADLHSNLPVQATHLSEPLFNQFSGEPQIVRCLTVSQLICGPCPPPSHRLAKGCHDGTPRLSHSDHGRQYYQRYVRCFLLSLISLREPSVT
jgi:hypothetical protein